MFKIVLTRSMVPGDIQYIKDGLDQKIAGKYEFVVPDTFTEECICAEAVDADILLGPYVTRRILENAGIDCLIECPFIPEILSMGPEQFVEEVLLRKLKTSQTDTGSVDRNGYI